jgi:hypothetical protein
MSSARAGDGKLVGSIVLHDPSSDATAEATGVFVDFANAGVTTGAYVQLSGTWKRTSALADSRPAIEIDRLSLSALSDSSWRILLLTAAARWFHPWRNALNVSWTMGPHKVVIAGDEIDSAATELGAGEVMFPPFIREED